MVFIKKLTSLVSLLLWPSRRELFEFARLADCLLSFVLSVILSDFSRPFFSSRSNFFDFLSPFKWYFFFSFSFGNWFVVFCFVECWTEGFVEFWDDWLRGLGPDPVGGLPWWGAPELPKLQSQSPRHPKIGNTVRY